MLEPKLKLSDGNRIPRVGFGTWQNKNEKECVDTINFALETGYRHIDTAQTYENEQYIGKAIKNSGINRDELFITTKIWLTNFLSSRLLPSLDKSLDKLQTDYVDLLLLHFPVPKLRNKAWKKMEEAHRTRKAKSIGVSNFTVKHLESLLSECSIKPVVNQVELHVYLQQPDLRAFCDKNGIVIEAYSPLAHGYGLNNSTLQEVAKKYNKTSAQIMIRWCLENNMIPLPKSTTKKRIIENFNVFDFGIDTLDMKRLAKLDENHRTCWNPTHVP
jgi:diketogulonate reductase-like aldo/keto reductase